MINVPIAELYEIQTNLKDKVIIDDAGNVSFQEGTFEYLMHFSKFDGTEKKEILNKLHRTKIVPAMVIAAGKCVTEWFFDTSHRTAKLSLHIGVYKVKLQFEQNPERRIGVYYSVKENDQYQNPTLASIIKFLCEHYRRQYTLPRPPKQP